LFTTKGKQNLARPEKESRKNLNSSKGGGQKKGGRNRVVQEEKEK